MKKIRVSAKNVQKAIEEGLKSLDATQDQVDIKIIDEGGLFKKATVELTLDKDVEETRQKEEQVEKVKEIKEEDKKLDKKASKEQLNKEKQEEPECAKVLEEKKGKKTEIASGTNAIEVGTNFLKGLFERMNVEAEVSAVELENGTTFNASGSNVSTLIGKRGETLNAIQDVLSNVLRNAGFRETRFYFDVENYKNRREISLTSLAERMANKALKINKPIKLERMSAYERKIIHSYLQTFEGVTTKSEGEEPNRYLIILPVKED